MGKIARKIRGISLPVKIALTAFFTAALTVFMVGGWYQPGTSFSDTTVATPPTSASGTWTNPTNALTSNNSYATYTGTGAAVLTLGSYGFNIPAGSTINGIQVTVEGLSSGTNATNRTIRVGVTKNGTADVGTTKTQALTTTENTYTLGTTSDLWGTTWTVADINAGTFGIRVRDNDTTSSGTFSIDVVNIIVTYTPPVNGTTATALTYSGVTTSSITVSAPFSGDQDSDNSCVIRWGTSAGSYPNTASATRGAGAYTATVNGLSAGTTYYFEAAFTDADGLTGSPQTGSRATTAINDTTAGALTFSNVTNSDITITAPFTGDQNGNNGCVIEWGTTAGSYPNAAPAPTRGAGAFTTTVSGLSTSTTYYFRATFTDADGITGSPVTGSQATVDPSAGLLHNSANLGSTKWGGNWGVAGGQYGEFSCETCHTMDTTNIKGVVQSIPASIGPNVVKPINFLNLTSFGNDSVARTTSDRICEACHTQTDYHRYDTTAQPSMTHPNGDCMGCHPHKGGFKAMGCTSCHGHNAASSNPIASNKHGAHISNIATLGANYGCADCHAPTMSSDTAFSNAANHNNETINYGGTLAGTINPDKTCTSYCHTDGKGGAAAVSVVWNAVANNLDCKGCHGGTGSFGEPGYTTGNSHAKHVSSAADCASCHFATTETGTTIKGSHTNQSIDVNGSSAIGYAAGAKTCSTASCHANVYGTGSATTPAWGTAAGCSACHSVAIGADGPVTGSHTVHAGSLCTDCHATGTSQTTAPSSGHADGNIDVTSGYPANVTKHASGTYTGTCSTATCHANVYGTGSVATPVWGTTGNGCSACHSVAIGANGPATGSHTVHAGSLCTDCHATGTSQTTAPSSGHADGNIDVTSGYPANVTKHASGTYTGTCSTATCHANVYGTGSATTPVWGTTGNGCAACHSVAIGANGPATGSHTVHAGSACTQCHATGTTATTSPTSGHADGNIDVANVGYPVDVTKHAAGSGYTTCSTASCHANVYGTGTVTTPAWGATAGCSACHSVAIGANGPATGSHTVHAGSLCTDCHATGTSQTTVPSSGHADGNIDVTSGYPANVTKHASGTYTGTCSTATCHANVYGTGSVTTPVWGTTGNGCSACHSVAIGATGPATGSHTAHTGSLCTSCHAAGTTATTEPSTGHADGNIDVANVGYPANVTKHASGSGYTTCSTASCHANVYGTGSVATPAWGADANCSACHTVAIGVNGPNTGSHTAHAGQVCTSCHAAGTTATTMPTASHNDGDIDITVGGYPVTAKHAAGSYTGTCSNISCHSSGAFTPAPVLWGSTLNCKGCHATLSAGHSIHVSTLLDDRASTLVYDRYSANASSGTTYKFGCANCHPVNVALHINGSVDVDLTTTAGSGSLKANNGAASYNGSKQCLNVYCHSNGYTTTKVYATTPAWGGSFAGDRCAGCHGNSPNASGQIVGSAAHAKHVVGIHYKGLFNGTQGLLAQAPPVGNNAVNAAHGKANRSTTINCNICHNDTVQTSANDSNAACVTCHTTGNLKNPASLIGNTSFHVNGQVNVKFAGIKMVSKAQVREGSFDNYTATSHSGWTRNRGYKNYTSSYDVSKSFLNEAGFDGATDSCSNLSCHNGFTVKWTDTVKCQNCHTRL